VRRFDALTGGEDVGAARFGVSTVFALGNLTLARGTFGVFTGGGSLRTEGGSVGADVTGGAFSLTVLAGVLGSVMSDVNIGIWSDWDEMVMAFAGLGT
jgi:hypothetical protein